MTMPLVKTSSVHLKAESRETQEEKLVIDARAGLTPSQMVENKLRSLLRDTPLPISQMISMVTRRGSR